VRFLLDTHTLLCWLSNDDQLGQPTRDLIADPAHDVLVSVVSLWEIQVKVRIGKLEADLEDILHEIEAQAFDLLPISSAHLLRLGALPAHHKDPFDHLLIAQAIADDLTFVSGDAHTPRYPVKSIHPGAIDST
jgi:PIN domain nuclease of toxin-antitoxin system